MLHEANFQAKSVTSAMEKTRQDLESIGRMLYAQCIELVNPAINKVLPPNLASDEPSKSFPFKHLDIMIAALIGELSFLASSVNHVHAAEMGT